jgi:eukaryotic-like serine/threonine-protein kinase
MWRGIMVGSFLIERLLRKGASTESWRALETKSGTPVAITFLTAERAKSSLAIAAIKNEGRVAASLDHSSILRLLDYGESKGLPYLVTELASSALGDLPKPSKPELRAIMLVILDALAHAHARGVIHGHLSPKQILIAGPHDPRPGLKIAGFGGTLDAPWRLAPEQQGDDESLIGPWTDLFALGCIAEELFLESAPPALTDWLARLRAPVPDARFRSAADASYALAKISFDDEAEVTRLAKGRPRKSDAPPPPKSWLPAPQLPPVRIPCASMDLYAFRYIPFVGREAERDRLWEALIRTRIEGQPRAFVLSGPAGSGKSRLAEWLCQRAIELGAAIPLEALHSSIAGASDGMSPMIARHIRAVGLERDALIRRCRDWLTARGVTNDDEALALAELVHPSGIAWSSAERTDVLSRFLYRAGLDRPVILWIDDAHWSSEAIEQARALLATNAPALILLTVRNEALLERHGVKEELAKLVAHERAKAIELGPLSSDEQHELARSLVPIDDTLAAEAADRTAGNPLFLVQLVRDWIMRGALVSKDERFVLKPGEAADLPDDLHAIWCERIRRVTSGRSPETVVAIEIAAILGQSVRFAEWTETCARCEPPLDRRLVNEAAELLFGSGLARRTEGGLAFVHGMIRESVARSARERNRSEGHHLAAARMMQSLYSRRSAAIEERLGRHLLAARDLNGAIEPLFLAARARLERSDLGGARALLEEREAAMTIARVSSNDERWSMGWSLAARVALSLGDHESAERTAGRLLDAAERFGWSRARADATYLRAEVAKTKGDFETAFTRHQEAAELYRSLGDVKSEARSICEMGYVDQQRGEARRAVKLLHRARELFERAGDWAGLATAIQRLGLAARQRGDIAESGRLFEEARVVFEKIANRFGVASTLNGLGDVARYSGDLELADRRYRESIRIWEAIGARSAAMTPRLNLACLAVARARYSELESLVKDALDRLEKTDQSALVGCAKALLLPCLARRRAWGAWDEAIADAERYLEASGFVDADVARPVHLAAELALAAGEQDRARRAYSLALEQWRALGNITETAGLTEMLRATAS